MNDDRYNNSLLRQSEIVIPNKMLNNQLRFFIARINALRAGRILVTPGALAMNYRLLSLEKLPSTALAAVVVNVLQNPFYAHSIQRTQKELDFSKPIFSTEHEHEFPRGWISAGVIKETHPIYYINLKGNLVFAKSSREEYFRYQYQKSRLGKMGFHTWWLRGYLAPPKAPETVKKWARDKVRKTIEKVREELKPRRVPKPAMVPIRMRKNRWAHRRAH